MKEKTNNRKISEIAKEIISEWKPIGPEARPYVSAMLQLETLNDMCGADTASYVVAYFLGNATTWTGESARRIKKELNDLLKSNRKA